MLDFQSNVKSILGDNIVQVEEEMRTNEGNTSFHFLR